jgi:hypothetical protein
MRLMRLVVLTMAGRAMLWIVGFSFFRFSVFSFLVALGHCLFFAFVQAGKR